MLDTSNLPVCPGCHIRVSICEAQKNYCERCHRLIMAAPAKPTVRVRRSGKQQLILVFQGKPNYVM